MPRRRRGYPVAVLVGLASGHAEVWDVFSESVKPGPRVDEASKYALYEAVINNLRPRFNEGVKTILVAADKNLYDEFMAHIHKHHRWLLKGYEFNTATFTRVEKPATSIEDVRRLVSSQEFKSMLEEASEGDLGNVMGALERRLSSSEGIDTVLLSLEDAEAAVYGETPPEYLIILEAFNRRHGKRTMRLLQVAQNRGVKTKIIPSGSSHAARVSQLGGLVCMLRDNPADESNPLHK